MKRGPILVIPAFGEGKGGGHLVRSATLVKDLYILGREAYIFLPPQDLLAYNRDPRELFADLPDSWLIRNEDRLHTQCWEWIVVDRWRTTPAEYDAWSALGPTIGIDEGGVARQRFDFLLDLLPGSGALSLPNLLAPYLLPLPETRRAIPWVAQSGKPLRILLSFGAEDAAGLTLLAAQALAPPGDMQNCLAITAVLGPLYDTHRLVPKLPSGTDHRELLERSGIRVLPGLADLKEILSSFDLVITHFGLTAFEALHAGVPVCLVSPTAYHEKLAIQAGFPSAGIGKAGADRLRTLLQGAPQGRSTPGLQSLGEQCEGLARKYRIDGKSHESYGSIIASFVPLVPPGCPVCGDMHSHPVLARFPEKTYRRCTSCAMVYMLRLQPPPIEYNVEYFFESYQKQYGKTYLDDFPHLKNTGRQRLRRIRRLIKNKKGAAEPQLLDIGCAYGPFLAAAAEGGFAPMGIDPAAEAIRYVTEKLKLPAMVGYYPSAAHKELRREEFFDAVTLWYVIEHFTKPEDVLREVHRILKPGGVLAFSTPSFSGISSRKSSYDFLENSPADHWTLWDPRKLRKILDRFGFEVKLLVVTGHHPERFPLIGPKIAAPKSIAYRILYELSRLLKWGDTFEVYAVKKRISKSEER